MKHSLFVVGITLTILHLSPRDCMPPYREHDAAVAMWTKNDPLKREPAENELKGNAAATIGVDKHPFDAPPSGDIAISAGPEHAVDIEFTEQTRSRIRALTQQRFLSALDSVRDIVGIAGDQYGTAAQALSHSALESDLPEAPGNLLSTYKLLSAIELDLIKLSQHGLPGIEQAAREAHLTDDQSRILVSSQLASAQRVWVSVLMLDFECSILMSEKQHKRLVDAMASFARAHWNTILNSSDNAWSSDIRINALREAGSVLSQQQLASIRTVWFINGFIDSNTP